VCCIWPNEHPELGLKAPAAGSVSVSLMLHVGDTDAALQKTREYGAIVEREIHENYGSRNATIIDPFGHRWMLSGPAGTPIDGIRHGDIGYVSVWVPDTDRAAALYGHVLGWAYPAAHRVTNIELPTGISASAGAGGSQRSTTVPMWTVTDIEAAVARVREAGGTVLAEPVRQPYGVSAECTDDQGARFYLGEF
jgi:predicted enzyme related to lactoylglutathione lyase